MNDVKKELFLRDVLILANIIEMSKRAAIATRPSEITETIDQGERLDPAKVNWEIFTTISNKIKGGPNA